MKNGLYKDQIEELYAGEIYGEHLFAKMADRQQDGSQTRLIWKLISDVEKLMGQRLQPLALHLGVDTGILHKGAFVVDFAWKRGRSRTDRRSGHCARLTTELMNVLLTTSLVGLKEDSTTRWIFRGPAGQCDIL